MEASRSFPWQNLYSDLSELFTFAENFQRVKVNTEEMNPSRIKLLKKKGAIPYSYQ